MFEKKPKKIKRMTCMGQIEPTIKQKYAWYPEQSNAIKDGKRLENRNVARHWWLTLLILGLRRQRTL